MIQKLAIVGGGITGLAAAYRAQQRLPNTKIVLLESASRLGGVLRTSQVDDFLIEHSADMFTTEPATALELCRELGKEDQLVETIPVIDRAFIATEKGMHPVPRGFSLMMPGDVDAVLNSPLLDPSGKQRFLKEAQVPVRSESSDESLESFAVRRFGKHVFETLIQPLAGGIYTADPTKLSMNATMKRFVDMERNFGSLIAAGKAKRKDKAEQQASGARYNLFRAPVNGMGQLVDWLVEAIPHVKLLCDAEVQSVSRISETKVAGHAWKLGFQLADRVESVQVDGIVITSSARSAANLLHQVDFELASRLGTITAASSAVVVLGVERSRMEQDFRGYGIVYPAKLDSDVIACSFSSNKFPGRAVDDQVLIRCFIGGALKSELVELSDEELVRIAVQQLDRSVGFDGVSSFHRVQRWKNCMPQYHLGHLDLVTDITSLMEQHPGLELAGNSYHGVGIPACIESGFTAIERLLAGIA